ncbi:O-methyltransferase [Flaviaesturariibacter amylovorans]|uniref:O-methyltransferase n=1 Tax=Flaviaesturariibacter amylovorans TaxID=1084520 RepID=A0ABP8HBD0_9BACT
MTGEIDYDKAHAYAERFSTPDDELLQEVIAYTAAHHPKAHMLSGHLQGRFLRMLSHMIRPRRVLELGTFTGYSALCLAEGLTHDGELHTVELRPDDAAVAQGFFKKKNVKGIISHIGEAFEIIGELRESWDLVFIDADKVNYTAYFKALLPQVRPGGFILADNTLFHGQVLTDDIRGKNAKAIQEFNDFVRDCPEVEQVLLPVRDGLTLIRKVAP